MTLLVQCEVGAQDQGLGRRCEWRAGTLDVPERDPCTHGYLQNLAPRAPPPGGASPFKGCATMRLGGARAAASLWGWSLRACCPRAPAGSGFFSRRSCLSALPCLEAPPKHRRPRRASAKGHDPAGQLVCAAAPRRGGSGGAALGDARAGWPSERPSPAGAGGHGRRAGRLRGWLSQEVPRALPGSAFHRTGGPARLLVVGAVRPPASRAEREHPLPRPQFPPRGPALLGRGDQSRPSQPGPGSSRVLGGGSPPRASG